MVSIKEKLLERIKEIKLHHHISIVHNYDSFQKVLENNVGKGKLKSGNYKDILAWAKRMENENNALKNEYDQALKADLIERRRFLRYRIYTAVGIAAVLLITGYLAQRWNIPLPLLRIAQ